MNMSYEEAAMTALVEGVRSGRQTALREAPYIQDTLGFKPDVYTLQNMPIKIGPLPEGVLGVTHISPEGKAVGMRISDYIPKFMTELGVKYKKSTAEILSAIYRIARHTTEHEGYHVFSSPLARGEEIDDAGRDIMESITTRGRYKMKKRLGEEEDARFVKNTNPYPRAWIMSELADWAPYEGSSGRTHYKGYLADSETQKFSKTVWNLTKSVSKAAWRKGIGNIGRIMAQYAMQAA